MTTRLWSLVLTVALGATAVAADDWPQWRGPGRDGKAEFQAPKAWPKELAEKWKVSVGDGVSTPALVGDKLFVFARQKDEEVLRALDAATGKELWQDKYPAKGATGPASGFAGPRASPSVVDGKVYTQGVSGTISCNEAATGKLVWRNDDHKGSVPRFYTSSSPLVVDGLCVVQVGGEGSGALVALDAADGKQKWKWADEGTAYASPVLMTVDGVKAIVAETSRSVIAVGAADGKLLWKTPFAVSGRGYNASTPMVDAQKVIYSGSDRGTRAYAVAKKGDGLEAKELWANADTGVIYNTPVLRDGLVFGLTKTDSLFCIDEKTGKTAWTEQIKGNRGYGTIVAAGPVLMSLTPAGQLLVYEPSAKEYKQLASYKVASAGTYAYPVVSGKRIFIKDKDSVTLWTVE